MRYNQFDRFLHAVVKQAGQSLRRNFGKITTGTPKTSQHDIVTAADFAAEDLIISAIRKKFPYHNILSEESGYLPGRSPYTWVIDPLDGTANFAKQIPLFGVIIAFVDHNTVTHGAIYDPIHDQLYYAKRGQGSVCNNLPIQVTTEKQLEEMVVIISNIRLRSSMEQFAHWRSLLALYTTYYKAYGSAAQALMALAAGKVDTYIIGGAYPWDIAAGALIAKEAGAKVSHIDGQRWNWRASNQHVLIANPSLHKKVLSLLSRH